MVDILERALSKKGDCVKSGCSDVMVAQFILNCANARKGHVVFNFIHDKSS